MSEQIAWILTGAGGTVVIGILIAILRMEWKSFSDQIDDRFRWQRDDLDAVKARLRALEGKKK